MKYITEDMGDEQFHYKRKKKHLPPPLDSKKDKVKQRRLNKLFRDKERNHYDEYYE